MPVWRKGCGGWKDLIVLAGGRKTSVCVCVGGGASTLSAQALREAPTVLCSLAHKLRSHQAAAVRPPAPPPKCPSGLLARPSQRTPPPATDSGSGKPHILVLLQDDLGHDVRLSYRHVHAPAGVCAPTACSLSRCVPLGILLESTGERYRANGCHHRGLQTGRTLHFTETT